MIKVIERTLKSGRTYLYLDIYYNMRRTTRKTGLMLIGKKSWDDQLRKRAEQMAAELTLKLAKHNFNLDALQGNYTNFILYYKQVQHERPDYVRRGNVLKHLENFSGSQLQFEQVNERYWEKFSMYLKEIGLAQSTIFTMFGILKTVLNRAVRDRLINENPLKYVSVKNPKTERKFLTYDDLKKLISVDCSNQEVKQAFLFGCFTGVRLGDIEQMEWSNIKDDTIRITQQKTQDFVSIPLTKPAKELLDSRVSRTGKIFHLPSRSIMSTIITSWAQSAGFPGITFHSSRHTFATLALTFGASIESVSGMLGHSDIKTTRIYARILDEKKKKDAEKFPDFDF